MIALPAHGFVMLSMPKAASTSLVASLHGKAELMMRHNPHLKHMNCRQFDRRIRPILRHAGYKRADYELCSLFREPIDWLESWWRYRQRPALAAEGSERYTGDISFERFAELFVAGDQGATGVRGRPAQFVALDEELRIGVDRIFCLERPDVWQGWIAERMGAPFKAKEANVSRVRPEIELSPGLREQLVAWFRPEYEIYERVRETGMLAPPRGHIPGL